MVVTTCDNCGKEIRKRPRQMEKYDNHFCSRACHIAWRYKSGIVRREKADWDYFNKIKEFAKINNEKNGNYLKELVTKYV